MKNVFINTLIFLLCFIQTSTLAQHQTIKARITDGLKPIEAVKVEADGKLLTSSDSKGLVELSLSNFPTQIRLSKSGFEPLEITLHSPIDTEWVMISKAFDLNPVVVTSGRREQFRFESIVPTSGLDRKLLDFSQSNDLAESLRFSPGMRIENNCSNCGFTQLRLNGLEGPYTQILINSRPVFSALSGVYGLEQMSPEMIERVEIVRGGGSAMYGGNAIAGTVNIITRKPSENLTELGTRFAFMPGGALEQAYSGLITRVDPSQKRGFMLQMSQRQRDGWDKDSDGYTELPALENTSFGFQGFLLTDRNWNLQWNSALLREFRRGGSDMDRDPELADLAEQTLHHVFSTQLSADKLYPSKNLKWSTYTGLQYVDRASYYGAGGNAEILRAEGLSETEIAASLEDAATFFGNTYDLSWQLGTQWLWDKSKHTTLFGLEALLNQVNDNMPGYERSIDQTVQNMALFANREFRINSSWELSAGARWDLIHINGQYQLGSDLLSTNQQFTAFNPRLHALHRFSTQQDLRFGYSRGFRAPQAFDEDLHIEMVGGEALFIRLSDDLKAEHSHAFNLRYDHRIARGFFGIELFHNTLINPFVNVLIAEEETVLLEKQNADESATVFGINLEAARHWNSKWSSLSGFTLQRAHYSAPIEVVEEEIFTDQFLRTPQAYGYFTLSFAPNTLSSLRSSATFTGPMDVLYQGVMREIGIYRSPSFLEMDLLYTRSIALGKGKSIEAHGGVRNLFNAFQRDFESGRERDAGYVYGPIRPRMITFGLRLSL